LFKLSNERDIKIGSESLISPLDFS